MKQLILFICCISLFSCLKEEIPIQKNKITDMQTASVVMGINYDKQLFFNLENNAVVSQNEKAIWDIAFENGENGHRIITNTGKYMLVYKSDKTELYEITNKSDLPKDYTYDSPNGNLDSTGIGNWQDGFVRALDLGIVNNTKQGWYKLKVHSVSKTEYTFEFAKMNETTSTFITIDKKEDYNFTYFSLIDKKVVDVAPENDKWDLMFAQFITHLTTPIAMDYLVTGCLTNPYKTKSALVTNKSFQEIDLSYALSLDLSERINTIGYDWKDVGLENIMDGGSANYEVYDYKSYVIQNQKGNYYKLRFISFYSDTGEKGTPTFEYKLLE